MSGAVSLVVGALLAWLLARSITVPLQRAEAMARSIAQMDLTDRAASHYANDETGRLLRSIDTMRDALTRSLLQVRHVVDSISTASTQIASGNQDLSARTEHTAGNLEETAASMEELTATVRQSAESAAQANQLAASAGEVARRGGAVVAQVVTTMEEINEGAKRIADITGIIDGIAFQTNILALSAAATEQGAGIGQVNVAVTQLDQMTQQNAALVEESTAAAESLKEQALRLSGVVGAFRLNGGAAPVSID